MSTTAQVDHDAPPSKRARVGQRTMLACIECKKRKLKCDASIPICLNCSKSGRQECLIEDPATGMHRPRDYIRSLESRIAFLENLLHDVRPDVADDHFAATSPNRRHNSHDAGSVDTPDQGLDTLSSEVALLCVSAAGREPQYFGPSSAVSFSRIASTAMGLRRHGAGTSSQHSNAGDADDRRAAPTPKGLPSRERLAVLSKAYFGSIHPQYPFLHRPTIQLMEKECLQAENRGNLSLASEMSLFFVFMVCAIGSLTQRHSEVGVAEGYYASALSYIHLLLDLDNLQSIQALLCCAVYSIRSPIGVSLWKISGMAIRHCVELGYHRSAHTYRRSTDFLTQQMSQRCFWIAYDIDRVASFVLGRPVGLSDQAIDAELPLDMNDQDIAIDGPLSEARTDPNAPWTTMTGALHAIKLRQLWSKISTALYSGVSHSTDGYQQGPSIEGLRQELEAWWASTPQNAGPDAHLGSQPFSVFVSEDWFRLAYHYSMLLLYRHYIMETPHIIQKDGSSVSSSADADTRLQAFQVCADHAREICLRYRKLYQNKGAHLQFTWGSLHILFLAGLTYLYCLWRSPRTRAKTRQTTIMQTCMACTTVLIIIAERWHQAAPYRDIFETLSERTMRMMCGTDPSPSGQDMEARDSEQGEANERNQSSIVQDPATFDNMYDTTLDIMGTENANGFVPLQSWINNLEYITAPGDPQWLAQELLQGIRNFDSGTM